MKKLLLLSAVITALFFACKKEEEKQEEVPAEYQNPALRGVWVKDSFQVHDIFNDIIYPNDFRYYGTDSYNQPLYYADFDTLIITANFFKEISRRRRLGSDTLCGNSYFVISFPWYSKSDSIYTKYNGTDPYYRKRNNFHFTVNDSLLELSFPKGVITMSGTTTSYDGETSWYHKMK